jgi:signal transduction histidine kinase/3D (Asp-Asp-Asp) domain-containing protein
MQVMRLGIPPGVETHLGRRLITLTVVRLGVLGLMTVIIEFYYFRELPFGGYSSAVASTTVGVAFFLSALYAIGLRRGRHLEKIAFVQLATDQMIWTAIVYISGGATSGSASLYGLTCVSGAILLGTPGAVWSVAWATVTYLALCIGLTTRMLPAPPDQAPQAYLVDPQQIVYPAFATIVATALVASLAAYLAERLRTTGGRLEEATKRAEEAERLAMLGRLAAALAHEIRNPLGSIRGSVELLRTGGQLDPDDQHLCQIVEREVARLNDLVTDMVDLSRPRQPDRVPTDLAATTRNVVELARGSGRGEDVAISYVGPTAQGIFADPAQMRQVVWNLVRNALQASAPGGEVTVTLSGEADGDILLSVQDRGAGIPSSRRDEVFDAFFTTRAHGVGIGLAVVKQVVDAHGFSIRLDSEEGEGATFVIRIPKDYVRPLVSENPTKAAAVSAIVCSVTLALAGSACGGSDWVRDSNRGRSEGEVWWGFDIEDGSAGAGAATASPTSSAAAGPPPTAVELKGQQVPTFRNTYYDFPQEPTTLESGETRVIYDASCKPIRTVSQSFHDKVCVQGSGRLATGETVSFAKRDCECASLCPRTDQKICFDKLDQQKFPYGRGSTGAPITPLRSVAVDPEVIPMKSVLYIPDFHGLRGPDGKTHDGCFVAEDRGLKVKGNHVDIFTGNPATTESWNKAVPSNKGVKVIVGATRCSHLSK